MINYAAYFDRMKIKTVDPSFYDLIGVWDSWYRGDVANFHHYTKRQGRTGKRVTVDRASLGMAKKVSEDVADFLANENNTLTIGQESTSKHVNSVLEAERFRVMLNQYQERKAATGTAAYVAYIADAAFDGTGRVVSGSVRIGYYDAPRIFPISWRNGRIIDCAFSTEAVYDGHGYAMIQRHILERSSDGTMEYVITNDVVDEAGDSVERSKWDDIPQFRGVAESFRTGSAEPQFAIDKLAIVNNAADPRTGRSLGGDGNPLGIAIFANAIPILKKLDLEYDSYEKEFDLGRKRLFVSPAVTEDEHGKPVFDSADIVFDLLPEDYLSPDKPIVESNMSLRIEEHSRAINQDLDLLSLKCGFGTQYYSFDRAGLATATQVISENSDLYRTIKKHEIPLEETIRTLIRAIIRLGIVAGVPGLDPNAEIKIGFDDSIIEDKDAERKRDREDVAMGAMGIVEYRAKWYGETEEEAAKKIPDQLKTSGVIM